MARTTDPTRRTDLARQAFDIVKERGLRNTSMSDIAKGLGIKRPTLYWYFKDLGQIVECVLEELLDEQDAFLAGQLGELSHPIDLLDGFVERVNQFFAGREELVHILLEFSSAARPGQPNPVIERVRDRVERRRSFAIQMLEQGIEDGLVAPCDVPALVDLVSAAVDGALLHRISLGIDERSFCEAIRRHILGPLRLQAPKDKEA
jgi:AcrR family transcriptional regulator